MYCTVYCTIWCSSTLLVNIDRYPSPKAVRLALALLYAHRYPWLGQANHNKGLLVDQSNLQGPNNGTNGNSSYDLKDLVLNVKAFKKT